MIVFNLNGVHFIKVVMHKVTFGCQRCLVDLVAAFPFDISIIRLLIHIRKIKFLNGLFMDMIA